MAWDPAEEAGRGLHGTRNAMRSRDSAPTLCFSLQGPDGSVTHLLLLSVSVRIYPQFKMKPEHPRRRRRVLQQHSTGQPGLG